VGRIAREHDRLVQQEPVRLLGDSRVDLGADPRRGRPWFGAACPPSQWDSTPEPLARTDSKDAVVANDIDMSAYTKTNLRSDVENQAPKFDMPSELDARFARTPLGARRSA
jgi:hypothetical protein